MTRIELSDLAISGGSALEVINEMQTALGELARSARTGDQLRKEGALAALLRGCARLLTT